jgi:hypothetical protein
LGLNKDDLEKDKIFKENNKALVGYETGTMEFLRNF